MGCSWSHAATGVESLGATAGGLGVFEKTDFHEDYEVLRRIGKGAFAHVYSVEHVGSRKQFAAKVALVSDDPVKKALLLNEISIMRQLKNSEYCVGANSAYVDSDLCYIVMEVANMSFSKALDVMDVTEKSLQGIFRDMLHALGFIHGLGIVHRDVKPDNFLCDILSVPGSVPSRVRLCDFGLSTRVPANGKLFGAYGTVPFMSPEMLKGPFYNEKADIWSVGVIVFVLLTGKFPYTPSQASSSTMKDEIRNGAAPVFTPILPALQPSEEAEAFGSALLSRVPASRPSALRALDLAFVAPNKPLGATCRINSLRALVKCAKSLGAFNVKDSRSITAIDMIMSDKQAAAYRKPKPATMDTKGVSVGIPSTPKKLAGAAPPLDSLLSLESCPRKWEAAASQQEQHSMERPSTGTPRPVGERTLATCKAETMRAPPSTALRNEARPHVAASHRPGEPKIGQGIKPVVLIKPAMPIKPVVLVDSSTALNLAPQLGVQRIASAPAQTVAPATAAVHEQGILADFQA